MKFQTPIEGEEILDQLNDYHHIKDSASLSWLITYILVHFIRTVMNTHNLFGLKLLWTLVF